MSAIVGADAHFLVTAKRSQVKLTFEGFEGDKHSGFVRPSDARTPHDPRGTEICNDRQVLIVSVDELAQIAAAMKLPEILAEWLGANLLLRDIPKLTQLPPCIRFSFSSGAVLVVEHENLPYKASGKVIQARFAQPGLDALFPKAALHLRGVVVCVEKPRVIREDDEVIVEVRQW